MVSYDERLLHIRRQERRREFCERFRRRLGKSSAPEPPKIPAVSQIADVNRLEHIFAELQAFHGSAPGPDRVTYRDLGRREVFAALRDLSHIVQAGDYRKSRKRCKAIPKPDGGQRTLALRSIACRVLSASLQQALDSFWESQFHCHSYGFRSGRGPWDLLLQLESSLLSGQPIFVQDDIRKAFDFVRPADVMHVHRQFIEDEELLDLIERVVSDPHRRGSKVGIDQGCSYSPTALNALLTVHLDRPLGDHQRVMFVRYADNLIATATDMPEGEAHRLRVCQMLEPLGLALKAPAPRRTNLDREGIPVTVLGIDVMLKADRVKYQIPEQAWTCLKKQLQEIHDVDRPQQLGRLALLGWLQYFGPAFETDRDAIISKALHTASRNGLREIARQEVERTIQSACDRWHSHKRRAQQWRGNIAPAPPAADTIEQHVCSPATEAGGAPPASDCPF